MKKYIYALILLIGLCGLAFADKTTELPRLYNNSVYDNYPTLGPLLIDITNEGRSKSGVINIYFQRAK